MYMYITTSCMNITNAVTGLLHREDRDGIIGMGRIRLLFGMSTNN